MDLDRALVSAILREGKDSLRAAVEKGLRDELLMGEAKEAYAFINDFVAQYHAFPTPADLAGKLAFSVSDSPSPSAFYVDEVLNRRLHGDLSAALKSVIAHLESRDPKAAYIEFEENLREIRKKQHVVQKSVNLLSMAPQFLEYYDRIKSGVTGILTPWRTLNEATLGMWPEDFILIVARLGVGKCVSFDTSIVDPITGVPSTIQELYESAEGTRVTTWSKDAGIHVAPITARVDTGHKECLKFTARNTGRSVTVTPEHPFLTPEGWKRADELKPGQSFALPARMPFPEAPKNLHPGMLDLLAIFLADGSCTAKGCLFTKQDPSIVDCAREAAASVGLQVRERAAKGNYGVVGGEGQKENALTAALVEHGMNVLSKDKRMPRAVWQLGAEQLSRFLTLFWQCDGYVTGKEAEITLASEGLIDDLQSLLLRFGVQTKKSYKLAKYQDGEKDSWRLRVLSSSIDDFAQHLPLWGDKGAALAALCALPANPNVGFPRVSEAFQARISALISERGTGRWSEGLLSQVGERLGWTSYFGERDLYGANGTLLLRRFEAFCDVYGVANEHRWLWDSDIFWDDVGTIEAVGETKVYDLTVASTSCFVANDFIVHNTWMLTLLAEHAWSNQGRKVLFASTEMSKEKILQRFYARHLRLPYDDFRKARLGAFAEEKFRAKALELAADERLFIVGGDFDFRIETLEAAIDDCEPDLVILDGAYLLRSSGDGRTEQAANSFDEIKRLAKRCRVPVVASTQFNRQMKANKVDSASVDKIALSDAAGWNADVVLGLIQTEDMRRDGRMTIKPMKIREGVGEDIECLWDFEGMNFEEVKDAAGMLMGQVRGLDDVYGTGLDYGDDDDGGNLPF